ncbi:hypothetical protein CCHR01_07909 [Colletotrichum chrysophilum]|uniref:Uncharacterized protein n=1 Tax=Colletotrichum chrysophilum TaxID=1836956 RepID=A0AAD9EFI4_9PEZI|nr:hypothetical protein CCHR01_07909 [Colletotrichum chrysophilum]
MASSHGSVDRAPSHLIFLQLLHTPFRWNVAWLNGSIPQMQERWSSIIIDQRHYTISFPAVTSPDANQPAGVVSPHSPCAQIYDLRHSHRDTLIRPQPVTDIERQSHQAEFGGHGEAHLPLQCWEHGTVGHASQSLERFVHGNRQALIRSGCKMPATPDNSALPLRDCCVLPGWRGHTAGQDRKGRQRPSLGHQENERRRQPLPWFGHRKMRDLTRPALTWTLTSREPITLT